MKNVGISSTNNQQSDMCGGGRRPTEAKPRVTDVFVLAPPKQSICDAAVGEGWTIAIWAQVGASDRPLVVEGSFRREVSLEAVGALSVPPS